MIFPEVIKHFLIKQRKGAGFFCVEMNHNHKILNCFGNASDMGIISPCHNTTISDFLPVLLTESFEKEFEIPFYNISSHHVCHIYFIKSDSSNYLLLIDKSEIFQITQKYQQFAHDDNISKNKFKRLSEELALAKNDLKKSNEEKATLIAMLSHELGTPLTSILGYTELLINQQIQSAKGLEIINRNAVYLKQMIENTLIFGRTEAGGIQVQLEEVSLTQVFSVINTIILPSAKNKNLQVRVDLTSNRNIFIDVARTQQILINLLNNAVKYTDEGFIELRFSIVNNHYIFSVIDSGIGIPEKQQVNIFHPWERVKESSESGAGIGLFISQKLAIAIGAELNLKCSSKDTGSIFELIVPISTNTPVKEFSQEKTKNRCEGKSILIIDDDSDILDLIDAFLYSSGLKIHTAKNIETALKILSKIKIDIVLTDYNLGTIRADTCVHKYKKLQNIPIILMTALPSEEINNDHKKRGFVSILPKPLNSKKLIQTIAQHIGN